MPRRDPEPLDLPDDEPRDRPRRRRPPPSGSAVPVWAWILGGVALLAVAGCAGVGLLFYAGLGAVKDAAQKVADEGKERKAKEQSKFENPLTAPDGSPVSAADLYMRYRSDPAEWAAKYSNRAMLVTLRVDAIEHSGSTASIREYQSRPDQFPQVSVDVPSGDLQGARIGGSVTAVGVVLGTGSNWITLQGHLKK